MEAKAGDLGYYQDQHIFCRAVSIRTNLPGRTSKVSLYPITIANSPCTVLDLHGFESGRAFKMPESKIVFPALAR